MSFPVTRTTKPKQIPSDVGNTFGAYFTDHMFLMNYEEGRGWFDERIVPFGPVPMHPSASAIQYGQSIFDGYKAVDFHQELTRDFRRELTRLSGMFRFGGGGQGPTFPLRGFGFMR